MTKDPGRIARSAPHDVPLEVVVTRATARGPVYETVDVGTVSAARKVISAAQDKDQTIAVSMAQPMRIARSNDALRSVQWSLDTLRSERAWGISRGVGITVAVVDTGVQRSHPDLSGRVLSGYNAIKGGTDVKDENGHGTHVAGTVVARTNNRIGVAGAAPDARILPVKVFGRNGEGSTAVVARGITWAANKGAKVINLSLAGQSDPAVASAVAYARGKNIVVVAAAGNSGCSVVGSQRWYPAALPGVVGVGSIDRDGDISTFSSCGDWVDVVAPGGRIASTSIGSGYAYMNGTSMASPFVAALAAQVIERTGSRYDNDAVVALIRAKATDRGPRGVDRNYGSGLIDPFTTLGRIAAKVSLSSSRSAVIAGSPMTMSGRLTYGDGVAIAGHTVRLSVADSSRPRVYELVTDGQGRFARSISLRRNARIAVSAGSVGSTRGATRAIAYKRVKPKWRYHDSRSAVRVVNDSRYGQKLKLQRLSSGKWRSVRSVFVTSGRKTWVAKTGRGTWRLSSVANSNLAGRVSPRWKS